MERENMMMETAYDLVLELLENPEPSGAWVGEFNRVAMLLEDRDKYDEDVPTENHGIPWEAFLDEKKLYIASPPVIYGSMAVRLVVNVMEPLRGNHINAHSIVCDPEGKMVARPNSSNTACLVTSSDAGVGMIFANWDFVAREGVQEGFKSGAVMGTWAEVIFARSPCKEIMNEELAHDLKMFNVYVQEKNLDMVITFYRKLRAASEGNLANLSNTKMVLNEHNRIGFYLFLVEAEDGINTMTHVNTTYHRVELDHVKKCMETHKGKKLVNWLLKPTPINGHTIAQYNRRIEKLAYPDKWERNTMANVRNNRAMIVANFPFPFEVPLSAVPKAWHQYIANVQSNFNTHIGS